MSAHDPARHAKDHRHPLSEDPRIVDAVRDLLVAIGEVHAGERAADDRPAAPASAESVAKAAALVTPVAPAEARPQSGKTPEETR